MKISIKLPPMTALHELYPVAKDEAEFLEALRVSLCDPVRTYWTNQTKRATQWANEREAREPARGPGHRRKVRKLPWIVDLSERAFGFGFDYQADKREVRGLGVWCRDNCVGNWCRDRNDSWAFASEDDAILFQMVSGGELRFERLLPKHRGFMVAI